MIEFKFGSMNWVYLIDGDYYYTDMSMLKLVLKRNYVDTLNF